MACRHCLRNCWFPSVERVALSCRGCRSRDFGAIVLSDWSDFAAAVAVERDGVAVDGPLRHTGHVACRHCLRNCRFPAGERVALSCRSCRSCDVGAVVLSDRSNFAAAVAVERDGVAVDGPLRHAGHVACRHCLRNCWQPSGERIVAQ